MTKTSQTQVVGISHDNVIEDFDFEKLARSDEIASDFDVCFGLRRFVGRMIVLCDQPSYVQSPSPEKLDTVPWV